MRKIVLGVFLLWSGAAVAATSIPAAPATPFHGPCAIDVARFCKDVPKGGGRRIACLNKHKAQLTAVCRERVPKLQALFEYGLAQQKKTDEAVAKLEKQKGAPSGKPAAPAGKTIPPK